MEQILAEYKKLSIGVISDAMDRLGIHGACFGISPLAQGYRMIGRAFTVKYLPAASNRGTVGDYIDDVPAGSVIVLDNEGRLDCTVWGELITTAVKRMGIAGTVIYGVCRDVSSCIDLKYPIFSRGKFMRTGKDRVQATDVNVPVSIGDVLVKPGDILFGTDDGLIVIPWEKGEAILSIAQSIAETEEAIRQEVLKGTPLKQAREKYDYHRLQSKQ
ncbi:RraA family protein [Paenibacillus filicis]|uniref:Putative 4-hydroxy-4-methyl-2-oxoglutarate aldolase n=1 Tax=Paenibacillus gyeongsangnamensis TaxID=3388067 RepID=A0ABT4QIA4_9BACL|nr:RraA family protein [Paenibacillus filicis]MCZ8516612.1 RraA family protein [Paenibacillus filicis]